MTTTKNVACTARHVGNDIFITYMGGPDQALVDSLNATVGGSPCAPQFTDSSVGQTATKLSVTGTSNHVIVTADFTDDTTQVILDTFC